ncbi:hypothetical protein GE023_005185 [Streptococcus canis]|nr:hypothetical protein [Streptococcus canis]QKG73714.1 hypothetical protein GE023_005185 [Streptococcus canis]
MEQVQLQTTLTNEQLDAIFGNNRDRHYQNLKRKALNRKRKLKKKR